MQHKTVDAIRKAVKQRPEEIRDEKRAGKKVIGWFGYTIPEEIIDALGMIPVRYCRSGDEHLVETGGRYISSQNCAYIRASAGLFAEKGDPYIESSDAIAFDTSCMQIYRLGEVTRHYFGKKTVFLGVPKKPDTPAAQAYFHKTLGQFTRELEEIAGRNIDKSPLEASVALYNSIRERVRDLYKSVYTASLSWEEMQEVVHAGYLLDRRVYHSLLQDLLNELEEEKNSPGRMHQSARNTRLLVSGSVIPPGDTKVSEIIRRSGAEIVGDDLWSGLNPSLMVSITRPTLAGVADAYLKRTPHYTLPCLEPDTNKRYSHLKDLMQETGAHGVILHTIRYCDAATFKAFTLKDRLKKEGIPMLEIHTEYSGSDLEAIRTRIEAFVELLSCRAGGQG